jgi:hypothetical protein
MCTNLVYYALDGGDVVFNCISMSLNFSLSAILGLERKCVNWLFCSTFLFPDC